FDLDKDERKYNLIDPFKKNTVPLHPYGWTALRFRANNPGVWLFHCHIESHFYMGMGVVFEEGIDKIGITDSPWENPYGLNWKCGEEGCWRIGNGLGESRERASRCCARSPFNGA
ncbi:hypothetical protein Dimus_013287, partial [Dionaea muscipula]